MLISVRLCVFLWCDRKSSAGSCLCEAFGNEEDQERLWYTQFQPKPTYSTVQSLFYLEYVSLEDVVSQFHSLLPI